MTTRLRSQPTRIALETGYEDGMLVFLNDTLLSVVTQLRNSVGEEFAGRWFIEAGFGPCSRTPSQVFDTAEDAMRWVRSCLGEDAAIWEHVAVA